MRSAVKILSLVLRIRKLKKHLQVMSSAYLHSITNLKVFEVKMNGWNEILFIVRILCVN